MAGNEDQQTDVTDGEEGTMTSEYMNKLHNERMQRQRNLAETVLSQMESQCKAFGGEKENQKKWEEAAKMIAYARQREKEGTEQVESKREKLLEEQKKVKGSVVSRGDGKEKTAGTTTRSREKQSEGGGRKTCRFGDAEEAGT